MKKSVCLTLLLAGALTGVEASANVLGWRVGIDLWGQEFEGDVRSGTDTLDIEEDLNFDDENDTSVYLHFEHPIPLLPNIRLAHTSINRSGFGVVDDIEFDGVELDGEVLSRVDLTHTDGTLYYEVLDNWVNLDLGLTARYFDDGVQIRELATLEAGRIDIDHMVPMVYGHARFDLPFTGLSIGIEGNYVSYDDDTLYDTKLNIGYTFAFGLGIEAGYRYMDFEYDDDDEFADVAVEGLYGGLFWDF